MKLLQKAVRLQALGLLHAQHRYDGMYRRPDGVAGGPVTFGRNTHCRGGRAGRLAHSVPPLNDKRARRDRDRENPADAPELQTRIDALKALGVSLRYAERKMQVKWGMKPDSKPMPVSVLYVVAIRLGEEPEQFATPKSGGNRFQGL